MVGISYSCFGNNNVEHDRAKQLVSEQCCTSNETPLLNQYEFKFAQPVCQLKMVVEWGEKGRKMENVKTKREKMPLRKQNE